MRLDEVNNELLNDLNIILLGIVWILFVELQYLLIIIYYKNGRKILF